MKRLVTVIAILISVSCGPRVPTDASIRQLGSAITYMWDDRTGICFAVVESPGADGFRTTSIATVPCEKIPSKMLYVYTNR
jgi:hypothetical protein